MKRLIILLVVAVAVGLFGVSSLPGSSSATHELPTDWDPLSPTCFDVNGDGVIDLPNDILGVISRFNARWGDDNYALVYDVTGGGVIDLPNDVLGVSLAHHPDANVPNPDCPLGDTQVIRAAAALLPYQDWQGAVGDGSSSSCLAGGEGKVLQAVLFDPLQRDVVFLAVLDQRDREMVEAERVPQLPNHALGKSLGRVRTARRGGDGVQQFRFAESASLVVLADLLCHHA